MSVTIYRVVSVGVDALFQNQAQAGNFRDLINNNAPPGYRPAVVEAIESFTNENDFWASADLSTVPDFLINAISNGPTRTAALQGKGRSKLTAAEIAALGI